MEANNDDNQQLIIPIEMIIKIISNLTDIKDIRNCMQLSKDIRNSILKTPEIMRKIKFQLDSLNDSEPKYLFIKKNEKFITSLSIADKEKDIAFFAKLRSLLSKMPYLEELNIEGRYEDFRPAPFQLFIKRKKLSDFWNNDEDSIDMTKLKALKLDIGDLEYIFRMSKNVKNLEKFTVEFHQSYDQSYEELMFDFICQQNNLEELTITEIRVPQFSEEDPSQKVKFRLKRFKFLARSGPNDNRESFFNFLSIHAETLEDLEVNFALNPQSLQAIFENSLKLTRLSITNSVKYPEIYSRSHPDWILPNVKEFEEFNAYGANFTSILKKFPNIESLKCHYINDSSNKFNKIKNLEMKTMNGLCYCRKEIMRNMLNDIKHVEHLVLKNTSEEKLSLIFEHLDILKELKTFSFGIKVETDYELYKLLVDRKEKVVKVNSYILESDVENYEALSKAFEGYQIKKLEATFTQFLL